MNDLDPRLKKLIKPANARQVNISEMKKQISSMKIDCAITERKVTAMKSSLVESKEHTILAKQRAIWFREWRREKEEVSEVEKQLNEAIFHLEHFAPKISYCDLSMTETGLRKVRDAIADFEADGATLPQIEQLQSDMRETGESLKAKLVDDDTLIENISAEVAAVENTFCRKSEQPEIPDEVFNIVAVDERAKEKLLLNILEIHQNYEGQLSNLQEMAASLSFEVTLSPSEFALIAHISDVYKQQPPLLMRLLARLWTRADVESAKRHRDLHNQLSSVKSKISSLRRDWKREIVSAIGDLKEEMMAEEARHIRKTALAAKRKVQDEICLQLKIELEKMRLEAAADAEVAKEKEEHENLVTKKLEEERISRENARREREKVVLSEYHSGLAAQMQLEKEDELMEEERRTELRIAQAAANKERVLFRTAVDADKEKDRRARADERADEERLRQENLEKLRCLVRVEVTADPVRMMADTAAWKIRVREEMENMAKPAKTLRSRPVDTFTDKQLAADSRTRVEAQLRAAGLLRNDYAREALAALQPPSAPRPDTFSTVFKHYNNL